MNSLAPFIAAFAKQAGVMDALRQMGLGLKREGAEVMHDINMARVPKPDPLFPNPIDDIQRRIGRTNLQDRGIDALKAMAPGAAIGAGVGAATAGDDQSTLGGALSGAVGGGLGSGLYHGLGRAYRAGV